MNRDEFRAADGLAKAVQYRGFRRSAVFLRISEFPHYVIREIFMLFVGLVETIARESANGNRYHPWPEDIASDARVIWSRIENLYE